MNHQHRTFSPLLLAALCGCAAVKYGNKDAELELKKLQPIPGKASLYVCRENASLFFTGPSAIVYVDNIATGTLKPNSFAHVILPPGKHDIYLGRGGLAGNSGVLSIDTAAGEVAYVWAGFTGAGFGILTVDTFRSTSEAEQCVIGADYAIKAD